MNSGASLGQWFSTPVLETLCPAHFVCLSYLTHSVQFIESILTSWGSESGVLNKGDIRNGPFSPLPYLRLEIHNCHGNLLPLWSEQIDKQLVRVVEHRPFFVIPKISHICRFYSFPQFPVDEVQRKWIQAIPWYVIDPVIFSTSHVTIH